jgi:hypothetical protein
MNGRGAASPTLAIRLPADAVMLLLSICGMAIGLAIDCSATPPQLLAALCTASAASLTASFAFHATMMPASYAAMTAAAILAAAFAASAPGGQGAAGTRALRAAMSVALMLVGMFAGGWLGPEVATALGLAPGFAIIVVGMVGGMIATSLALAAIARILDAAIARPGRRQPQYIMYQ